MPQLHAWLYRLIGLFRKNRRDKEMNEELQQHLEALFERNLAAGMAASEARSAALRQFGGVEQVKETAREQRVWMWADELLQDIRFGVRMLWRSPGFSVLAVLCLTLGIGTNAAVFSWIEGILFHPYPLIAHQDRMFALTGTTVGVGGNTGISYPDFVDFQKNCTLFESFIVDRIMGTTLSIGDRAERAAGGIVSANYFDAIGVQPILGREFRTEEGTGRNAHPVAVISYQTWKDRYKSDPNIIGRTQYLNGVQHTIIGVAPEKFYGTFIGYAFDFWVPTSMQETFEPGDKGYVLEDRGARWIEGYAFLKPGVSVSQAQAEISAMAKRLEADYPETNRGRGIQLIPHWRTPFNAAGNLYPMLGVVLGVVVFVLLISCANVSNLLLVRSLLRRHEMTVRVALGAGRARLLKQLFTEGVILSAIATVGGIAVAQWCRNALVLAFPAPAPGITINYPGQIDWRVLALSAGVCILATLLFALVPAFQASKVDLTGALKTETSGVVGGQARSRLRSTLVLIQISLSFVLLAGAALLLHSLKKIENASPGFSTRGGVIAAIDLRSAGYDAAHARIFNDRMLDHVRTLPAVESAAYARVMPFSYNPYSSAPIEVDGYQPAPNEQPTAEYNEVGEGYFATLGIPLISGREFVRTDDENAPRVAIVNEAMAAKYWPGKDAVGQRLKVKDQWMQVVGVAKLINYQTKLEKPKLLFYVPRRQNYTVSGSLLIRTNQTPEAMRTAIAPGVHALDSNLAPLTFSLQEQIAEMSYTQRLAVILLAIFGGIALFLAAIGVYAVMAYSVSQSTRELGLRMALGANISDLLRMVMSRGLILTAGGIIIGVVAALTLTRLMTTQLYKVSPRDPLAFGIAFVVMTIVAVVACFLPAWRATRIDPVRALRT
jgi:macrolide transport system ATP-binding/permease protein